MKRVLKIMIDIFQPDGIDWMNFVISRHNQYTFHHIVERSKGGDKSIDNGAILTRKAHNFLHYLENVCPEAYQDLQNIFMRINETKKPVTQEFVNEIDRVLYDLLIAGKYNVSEDVDLTVYCGQYYKGRKKARKCLK